VPPAEVSLAVLVVDDEAPIRQLERRVLEDDGYGVMEADSGLEAIDLLSNGAPLALLIADLDMPGLGGDEKVLYVTGHIDRLMDARPLWQGEAFLDKPFSPAGLREAVSLLLFGRLTRPEPLIAR
jgi:DNA-binding response OmpR family regulator